MRKNIYAGFYAVVLATAIMSTSCGSQKTAETSVAETSAAETSVAAETTVAETTEESTAAETGAAEDAVSKTDAAKEVSAESDAAKEAEMTVSDIYAQIAGQVALESPMEMPEDFIVNYYGIDPSALEEYVFSMSEDATSAETVVIMKMKDSADADALRDALQMVLDAKAAEMENYLPDQYQIVAKSAVEQSGDYLYLVISENADAVKQIIEAGIS